MNMRVQAPDGSEYTSTLFGWQQSGYPTGTTMDEADMIEAGQGLFHGAWLCFVLPPLGWFLIIGGLWHLTKPRARKARRAMRKAQRQAVAEAERITAAG